MTSEQLKDSLKRQIGHIEKEIVAREQQYDAEFNADGATFESRKTSLEKLNVDKETLQKKIKFLEGQIQRVDVVYN